MDITPANISSVEKVRKKVFRDRTETYGNARSPEALYAMAASYGGACSLSNHHGRCHRVAGGDTGKH
jgi:hypothetical protein